MRCEIKKEDLLAFLYGELEEEKVKKIKDHLAHCEQCRAEVNEIRQTMTALKSWKDEDPDFNFVFVEPKTPMVASLWNQIAAPFKLRPVSVGLPAFAVMCFLVLSFFNVNVRYHDGDLTASFGLIPKTENTVSQEAVAAMLTQFQQENYEAMMRMIQSSEYRQNQNFELAMNAWAAEYEKKRTDDLRMVNTGFGILQKTTRDQYVQTHEILKDLIQQASTDGK